MIEFIIHPSYMASINEILGKVKESLPEWNFTKMSFVNNAYDVAMTSDSDADRGIAISRIAAVVAGFQSSYSVVPSVEV